MAYSRSHNCDSCTHSESGPYPMGPGEIDGLLVQYLQAKHIDYLPYKPQTDNLFTGKLLKGSDPAQGK